jgi:hypothetical protein
VAIFRRKTPDEIGLEGEQYGSHKLIPLATRFQGRDAQGHQDLVRIPGGGRTTFSPNFINYNINNFSVSEHGTLETILANNAVNTELQDAEPESGLL